MSGVEEPEARDRAAGSALGTTRLLAFSDGVFAIAFTILVLDLVVPRGLAPDELDAALLDAVPNLLYAVLSFAVIGRFWLAHHELFDQVRFVDRAAMVINTVLLGSIAVIPSVTALVAEYGYTSVAVVAYSVVVGVAAITQLALWLRVTRPRLRPPDLSEEVWAQMTFGLAGAAAGFLVAIPVALVAPRAGMVCWLLSMVPVTRLSSRWVARHGGTG